MKKVLTMVGTSIFENYFKNNKNEGILKYYEELKSKRATEKEAERERIRRLKIALNDWIKKRGDRINISAEVKSVYKLKEELNDELELYLLCSDTILSDLAGEIVGQVINDLNLCYFLDIKTIKGLQIWDRKEFSIGMSNLITTIYDIANGWWENIIINITGGYKATVPYLTILAQINKCPIYYIFEETDALIKIPNIPLSTEWFDWDEINRYEEYFKKLEEGITDEDDYFFLINSDFYKKYNFLIWEEKPFAQLNPIGEMIYKKYKELSFEFLASDEVISMVNSDRELKNLIQNHFSDNRQRSYKTEIKNGHYVYDAGNNQLRIFYREQDNKIFVYKIFNNHDEYERYLQRNPYNENILTNKNFKTYKIKKGGA